MPRREERTNQARKPRARTTARTEPLMGGLSHRCAKVSRRQGQLQFKRMVRRWRARDFFERYARSSAFSNRAHEAASEATPPNSPRPPGRGKNSEGVKGEGPLPRNPQLEQLGLSL